MRATRHDCKDVIFKSRTRGGRAARVPFAENVFRSSARRFPRIGESRPETDAPNRGESNRGSQRPQNGAPAEKTGDKDPLRERKRMRRARSARNRARRRELRNCVSPAVSSFRRSRRKLVETGSRDALERLRGVAVSFLITAAPGGESLAQNGVPKGRPAEGARNREYAPRAITGGVITLPRCTVILGRRPRVS